MGKQFLCQIFPSGEVDKTRDGRTSVTVKMGKTRDPLYKPKFLLKIRDGLTIIRDKFAL